MFKDYVQHIASLSCIKKTFLTPILCGFLEGNPAENEPIIFCPVSNRKCSRLISVCYNSAKSFFFKRPARVYMLFTHIRTMPIGFSLFTGNPSENEPVSLLSSWNKKAFTLIVKLRVLTFNSTKSREGCCCCCCWSLLHGAVILSPLSNRLAAFASRST